MYGRHHCDKFLESEIATAYRASKLTSESGSFVVMGILSVVAREARSGKGAVITICNYREYSGKYGFLIEYISR